VKNKYILFVVTNFIFIIYVYLFDDRNVESLGDFTIAFLIHSLALTMGFSLLRYQKLPFVIPFAAFNILCYVIAPMHVDFNNFQLDVFEPSNLVIFNQGFLLFYAVYFLVVYYRIRVFKIPIFEINLDVSRFQLVLSVFYLGSFFLSGFLQFLHVTFTHWLLGAFVVGYFLKKNTFFGNLSFLVLLSFEIINSIIGGLIFPLVYLMIFFLLLLVVFEFNLKRHFFILLFLFLGTSYYASSFSKVKMDYRSSDLTNSSNLEKVLIINDLIGNIDNDVVTSDDDKGILWRLTYSLSGLSHVRNKTPSTVPFWDGESYYPIFYKLIPRILWPDKPREEMGQLFGHRYKILNDDNLTTSMNCPMVAEAYMNFGMIGIWLIFLIYGLIMANLFFVKNLKSNCDRNQEVEILNRFNICIVSVYLLQMESNFSMFVGKLIILFVIMVFVNFVVNNKVNVV
jgi:hypothetical protein